MTTGDRGKNKRVDVSIVFMKLLRRVLGVRVARSPLFPQVKATQRRLSLVPGPLRGLTWSP